MPEAAHAFELTPEDRKELKRRSRALTAPYRDVLRAQIILALADGATVKGTAREYHQLPRIVRKWRERFLTLGVGGLDDLPRPGRAPKAGAAAARATTRRPGAAAD